GAAKRALAELYRELPVEELWRTVKPKLASAVALYLAGYEYPAIAAAIGYSGRPSSATTVMKLLKRPEAERLIAEIRQRQPERIIAVDYGVTATLRAAAPRIAAGVAALAGGVTGPDGRPEGKAPRAADVIRAADLAFTIGGYKVQRREVTFNVLLDGLSDSSCSASPRTASGPTGSKRWAWDSTTRSHSRTLAPPGRRTRPP